MLHKLARRAAIIPLLLAAVSAGQAAVPPGHPGGNAVYGIPVYPACLDRTQSNPTPVVFEQIVDSLLDQDPQTGAIGPYLADKWSVEDKAKRYVFHIRGGVSFSNGEKLDAAVVARNFLTLWDMAKAGRATAAATYLKGFISAQATAGENVVITFDSPNAGFLQATTEKPLAILSPQTLSTPLAERCARGVIGSGPFVITDVRQNERIVVSRRADYNWGSSLFHHQGAAYLDSITFRVIPAPSIRAGGLLNGELDAFFDASTDDLPAIESAGARVITGTSAGVTGTLLFNTSKPIVSEQAVRQAVQHAVNRQEIVAGLYAGRVKAASGVLSSNHPDYLDQSAGLTFDPATSTRLLDGAGWKLGADGIRSRNGERLVIELSYTDLSQQPTFELIQQQLRKVGIEIKLVALSVAEGTARYNSGNWQLDWRTWGRADADALVYVYSTQFALLRGMAPRPELETLLMQQSAEADPLVRKQLVRKAQQIIIDEAYGVPIREVTLFIPVAPGLQDLWLINNPYRPVFFDAWRK